MGLRACVTQLYRVVRAAALLSGRVGVKGVAVKTSYAQGLCKYQAPLLGARQRGEGWASSGSMDRDLPSMFRLRWVWAAEDAGKREWALQSARVLFRRSASPKYSPGGGGVIAF